MTDIHTIHDELNKLDTFYRDQRQPLLAQLEIEEEKARAEALRIEEAERAAAEASAAQAAVALLEASKEIDQYLAALAKAFAKRTAMADEISRNAPWLCHWGHYFSHARPITQAAHRHGATGRGRLDLGTPRIGEMLADTDQRQLGRLVPPTKPRAVKIKRSAEAA